MRAFYYKYRIELNKVIILVSFFLFIYLFVNYIFFYVAPFFIAFIFSLLLNPLAEFITKKLKTPKWFASFICLLIIIFIVLFFGTNIITRIINEAQTFIKNLPNLIAYVSDSVDSFQSKYVNFFEFIPTEYQSIFDNIFSTLTTSLTSWLGNGFKNNSLNIVTKIPALFMSIILCLVATFFFINDRELINKNITQNTPYAISKNIALIRKGILKALGGYIKAQLIIMSIIATICVIGLTFIQPNYALFAGLGIAFVDALPIFGSGFILWPWIAFSFITGDIATGVGLAIMYGIILVSRQSLEPRILGKQIGIHPLITLMSIYIGLKIFGGIGFLLGPLVVIISKTILDSANISEDNPV